MFSLAHVHFEGKIHRGRRVYKDPEVPFSDGTVTLAQVIVLCAVVTFGYTRPDLDTNPVFIVGGYYNVCIAIDYAPCNLIGAIGYQYAVCCWLTSAYFFVKRAELADDLGLLWWGTLHLVRISAFLFCCTCPWMLICFLRPPDFTMPATINTHLRCFEIYIYGCIVWFFVQWYFGVQVISRKHPDYLRFTTATWVFVISSCLKLYRHQTELSHWWAIPEALAGNVTDAVMRKMHRDPWQVLYNPMQLVDYAWLLSMACFVHYDILCDWDPACDYGDCERGPSMCAEGSAQQFAPYLPASENEFQNESTMSELAESFQTEGSSLDQGRVATMDQQWGSTLGHVNCSFEIDDRIELLHPDLRRGFLEKPGKYEAVARLSLTQQMSARLAFRVNLPDADEKQLLIPYLKEVGVQSEVIDGQPLEKVADFLLQEDLKEFWGLDPETLIASRNLEHKPAEWSRAQWLWQSALNGPNLLHMYFLRNRQLERSSRHGKLSKNGLWGKRYFGGLPFRCGPGICKWGLVPRQTDDVGRDQDASAIKGKDAEDSYNLAIQVGRKRYLEKAQKMLEEKDIVFDFVVQVANHKRHDVENVEVIWPEDLSPYYGVGTLTIKAGEELTKQGKDRMVFSVWNHFKDHRPVGPLNHARGYLYKKEGPLTAGRIGHCPVMGPMPMKQSA